ncbi:hypothetical protein CK203_108809 [Vitis vinifera]|uniref:Uncharacterized protein n=1 Tax=Vitis vinifera TaxID=29760 RepID=A0A438BP84_VITVI|nr:hypothetical protein CK203_108809 [Vitis vinifera]
MRKFCNLKSTLRKFWKACKKFRKPASLAKSDAKFEKPVQTHFADQLCLAKTLRNLKEVVNSIHNSGTHFTILRIPTTFVRKAKVPILETETIDFSTPEPSVHRIPPNRVRTSGPGETSKHSQPKPQALADSQRPSGIARKPSSRGLWLPSRPLRAIQIVKLGHFNPSFIFTLRPYDSSQSFGIYLDYSRGTNSSAL